MIFGISFLVLPFCVLCAFWTMAGISFLRLGEFSYMIVLTILSLLLTRIASPSTMHISLIYSFIVFQSSFEFHPLLGI